MPAGAIASLFGGMVGLAGQSLNNDANIALNRQNNRAQRELAREADERNLRLWQMTNAYNSPLSQRKRLLDAGLNPGLMYGGIENTAGVPADSNVPTSNAGQRQFNAGPFVSAMNQAGSIIDANNSLNTRIKEAQAESIEIENDIKREQAPIETENLRKTGREIETRIANNKQQYDERIQRLAKDMTEQDERIRGMKISNDLEDEKLKEFKKFAPFRELQEMFKTQYQQALAVGQNYKNRLTKIELDRASAQWAAIAVLNDVMAEDQWLIDNFYPEYVESQTNHTLRGNRYKSDGTMPPAEWLQTLPPSLRESLLSDRVGHLSEKELSEYYHYVGGKAPEKTHWKFSQQKHLAKYRNLYWQHCNKSGINPIVQGYYNSSTSSESFGASAFGFGANSSN